MCDLQQQFSKYTWYPVCGRATGPLQGVCTLCLLEMESRNMNCKSRGSFYGGASNNGPLDIISRLAPFSGKFSFTMSFDFLILNVSTKFSLLTSGFFWKARNKKNKYFCFLGSFFYTEIVFISWHLRNGPCFNHHI